MQSASKIRSCSGSRDGVALLAVLAFVLLLSIMVVSYISFMKLNRLSTVSYSNGVQAQEIAKGGIQDIVSDLREEIMAGSIKDVSGTTFTQSGTTIYVPATNVTAEPARIGYTNTYYSTDSSPTKLSPTLVRVSRASANQNTYAAGGTNFFAQLAAGTGPYTNNIAVVPGYSAANKDPIINRASWASTATNSVNFRSVSPARWNKTYLLATNSATIPQPFTNAPPDWVYVTRTGSRVCTAAEMASLKPSANLQATYTAPVAGTNPVASPVIGRYAFVMYDEGALLDANVAGYLGASAGIVSNPADATTGMTQAVNGKSYLSFADLTQLPGLSASGAQTSVIDPLVQLRNSNSTSNGNSYLLALINYAKTGFLSFNSGDSPFLGRQDLINYFANIDAQINTSSATYSQALPYLGTFSRAVSAPTYSPPLNSINIPLYKAGLGTAVSYKDNAETSTAINRDMANVRFGTSGTVTHYYDDPSSATPSATYSVNAGDPLMQGRFSLAKINWLSQANPASGAFTTSSTYSGPIKACFGLVWDYPGGNSNTTANGGNKCWNYTGPSGSSTNPATTIETLAQVAAEATPREPNFFELLKAAILSGSLGLSPGKAAYDNGKFDLGHAVADYPSYASFGSANAGIDNYYGYTMDGHTVGGPSAVPAPAQISDMQIMQIGANIIDQYDTDSYPTAIYFAYTAAKGTNYDAASANYTGAFGSTDMVYGEENLPQLSGIMVPVCTTDGSSPITPAVGPLGAWWQPQLWNLHLQPNAVSATAPPPSKFIIAAYGSSKIVPTSDSGSSNTPLDGQLISFTVSNPLTAFTSTPLVLTQTGVPIPGVSSVTPSVISGSAAASFTPAITATQMQANSAMHGYSVNPFVGFLVGIDTTYSPPPLPSPTPPSAPNAAFVNYSAYGEPIASFCLGWSSTGTDFHPYSYISGIFAASYAKDQYVTPVTSGTSGSADLTEIVAETHSTVDPRTHHFPTWANWGASYTSTLFPTAGVSPIPHTVLGPGWGIPGGSPAPPTTPFVYVPPSGLSGQCPEDWLVNQVAPVLTTTATATYYADPDGVVRPGDGMYGNASKGDGMILFTSNGSDSYTPVAAGDGTNTQHGRRPVILNRPFRSVGELGYVFRDLPFKTLDFFTGSSADAALLDVFSLVDESKASGSQLGSIVAGQFNINNAPLPVIQAVLSGGSKKDLDPTFNLGSEAASTAILRACASTFASYLNPTTGTVAPRPLLNRAALVTTLYPNFQAVFVSGTSGTIQSSFNASDMADKGNKAYLEGPLRALSSTTNMRTWNLMIDIIAQAGQMSATATTLDNFVVNGERRYWLHVAIDRYTGRVVSQQLEPVYE